MILTDKYIVKKQEMNAMIEPFHGEQVRRVEERKVVSYGLSSFGYDIRLGREIYEVARGIEDLAIDPKELELRTQWKQLTPITGRHGVYVTLRPNGFALGVSMERFRIPGNVLGICVGKSTYARCGLIVNVTPLEPEWEGYLTLELHNTTTRPVRVYVEEGIAQLLFMQGDNAPMTTYADRKGKYQDQPASPVFARV